MLVRLPVAPRVHGLPPSKRRVMSVRDALLPPPESEMTQGMLDVASVTSTVCDLFGIPRPAQCVAPPFSEVAAFAARRTVTKALVFAADAIGAHLVRSYAETFDLVARHAPTSVEACAVMPSVTPVCFASMFTGAPPETHGIRRGAQIGRDHG